MEGNFSGFGLRVGLKSGGIHASDPNGGIFQAAGDKFLIKRDLKNPSNDIAEYIASKIFNAIAPGLGAEIRLTHSKADASGSNPYIASRFFKNYQDFYMEMGYSKRSSLKEALLPSLVFGSQNSFKEVLTKKNNAGEYVYQDYELIVAISLLISDFSLHSGNIGVVIDAKKKKLVRIDFGAAFREFSPDIYPFQCIKNRFGMEKNYFKRDHPIQRIFCKSFSDALKKVAQFNLDDVIDSAWKDVHVFEYDALIAFRSRINAHDRCATWRHLQKTLKQRQNSLILFADKIDNYLKADGETQQAIIKRLYQEAPELKNDSEVHEKSGFSI